MIAQEIYSGYLTALLAADRAACARVVQSLLASEVDLKELYVHLFQRSMYQIGELWEQQKVSFAVEHLATAITERMLTLVQAQVFGGQPRDRTIIVACVADEYHQFGGRMIADFCELRGWRGYFLGANTPLADLLSLIAARRPTLLGLSLSVLANLPALVKALDAVRSAHPHLPILVGGQAFRWGGLAAVQGFADVSFVGSLETLETRMLAHEQ